MAIPYLDPNFWQTAMSPNTGRALQFQPVQQQVAPAPNAANFVSLPTIAPNAPRFQFDPNAFQETTYNPNMRLNMFLGALNQANELNKTGANTGVYGSYFAQPPDQGPNNVIPNNNVPAPRSVASYLPPPPPAPAAPAGNNLFNNLQKFITVGGKTLINPLPGAYLPGSNLSYKARK